MILSAFLHCAVPTTNVGRVSDCHLLNRRVAVFMSWLPAYCDLFQLHNTKRLRRIAFSHVASLTGNTAVDGDAAKRLIGPLSRCDAARRDAALARRRRADCSRLHTAYSRPRRVSSTVVSTNVDSCTHRSAAARRRSSPVSPLFCCSRCVAYDLSSTLPVCLSRCCCNGQSTTGWLWLSDAIWQLGAWLRPVIVYHRTTGMASQFNEFYQRARND